jgi:hypothetical protein
MKLKKRTCWVFWFQSSPCTHTPLLECSMS